MYKGKKESNLNLQKMIQLTNSDIEATFNQYDKDKDNHLNLEEAKQLFIDIGLIEDSEDAEDIKYEVESIMYQYDKNMDGLLSIEEFIVIHRDYLWGKALAANN